MKVLVFLKALKQFVNISLKKLTIEGGLSKIHNKKVAAQNNLVTNCFYAAGGLTVVQMMTKYCPFTKVDNLKQCDICIFY